jgi:hypothetical protein
VNPKLEQKADGRYEAISDDERTLLLRMGDNLIRVSSDRVTPSPKHVEPRVEERRAVNYQATELSDSAF